jgi:hypothetical protein
VTEGRVTLVDGILAVAVLAGLVLNAAVGWWRAVPLAALVIVVYALRRRRRSSWAGSNGRRRTIMAAALQTAAGPGQQSPGPT